MSHDADEPVTNLSPNTHFNDVVSERLGPSRRSMLRGSLGLGALGMLGGNGLLAMFAGCSDDDPTPEPDPDPTPEPVPTRPAALGFAAVAKSLEDKVTVPAGYSFTVLYALGDPLDGSVSAYANDGTDAAETFAMRSGDHHDGMHFFGLRGTGYDPTSSDRGVLCINHEAITPLFVHPLGPTIVDGVRTVADEVLREFYLHGVSVVEVRRALSGAWSYAQRSEYNRRVHTLTEIELAGPLREAPAMVTKFSKDGSATRGTVNNCANGYTPWGTYVTCEENWAGYFRRIAATDNPNRTAKEVTAFARYGITGNGRELWATVTPDTEDDLYGRWNTMVLGASAEDDFRNVSNTFGWIVEIDPLAPDSTPKKRTAMGRFGHEGAWPAKAVAGKPIVFYSGDDSRGEYIYKYVSKAAWDPADANRLDRLAVGDKYLDDGTVYVARFNADGTGEWLELTFGKNNITAANPAFPFADQLDVALHTRLAADAAGATKMDRPEWGAVDPVTGAVYMTLTNNSASVRALATTDAANPRHYNDPKTVGGVTSAQYGNPNGHVIRWKEAAPEATSFMWDIYLFGANADADPANVNLSGLTADNDLSSPDGLWFSRKSNICWIQTDDGAFTDVTNCMLLASLPGAVGDGSTKTITNTDATTATKQVTTRVGAQLGDKLRRFLVGPKQCEITGVAETPDGKALFVNIQHPGEDTPAAELTTPSSTWPSTVAGTRPRSATIVITKNDGGVIGL